MKEQFVTKRFQHKTWRFIAECESILIEYRNKGYDRTLRQLYYILVARDLFPDDRRWRKLEGKDKYVRDPNGTKNAPPNYKFLGVIVNQGRMAGLFDWNMFVDRERGTIRSPHWESPAEIIEETADAFSIDKWKDQPNHVEVMVEKRALEGILIPACRDLGVNFTANKGYSSLSFMYRKGKELAEISSSGKLVYILYFGDHDPSGLDMDRDIEERLSLFSDITIQDVSRLALTMPQIKKFKPPEDPAKLSDTRAPAYIKKYGYSSWELDSVEPERLVKLVTDAVTALRDPGPWNDAVKRENAMKDELREWADSYGGGE